VSPVFLILALLVLAGAVAAMTLRNLVHCALALTVTFVGLAALYLRLNAQFVGFAQVLVYIGAVAMLIVFAILLTSSVKPEPQAIFSSGGIWGAAVALAVFGVIAGVIFSSRALPTSTQPAPEASVRQLGDLFMTRFVLPLEVLGLLLTAALIGAVIIAVQEQPPARQRRDAAPVNASKHPHHPPAEQTTPATKELS
jgi:NADH-quinone oxidoreductase subunit J